MATEPALFVLDGDGGTWQKRLEQLNIDVELADNTDQLEGNWLGCVVDGYEFQPDEIGGWKAKTKFLVEFCDFGDPSRHADVVLSSRLEVSNTSPGTHVMSGLRYALLDPAYRIETDYESGPDVTHIVVCFGARDGTNAMEIALGALNSLLKDKDGVRVTAVLGAAAPHCGEIERIISQCGSQFSLSVDEKDMPGLLHSADFAIGAGGMCLLERMACGVPSVTVATAENQIETIQQAAAGGGTHYAGLRTDIGKLELTSAVAGLMSNPGGRREMSRKARQMVDGWGASRVAEAIREHRLGPIARRV